jgi:cyclin-dependent kinase 7
MSALREIKFLRELAHPNVITVSTFLILTLRKLTTIHQKLLDVFAQGPTLNLVLEFLDTDLEALIKDMGKHFTCADVKSWMAMAFRGLEFCHRNGILHRVSCL